MKNVIVAVFIIVIGFVIGWFIVRPKAPSQIGLLQKDIPTNISPTLGQGSYNPIEVPVSGVKGETGETKGGIRTPSGVVAETRVLYEDDGFHEPVVYVKLGSTVVFQNNSNRDMWIASAPHPTHTAYPEFDQKKSVVRGGLYTFIFTKVGAWKYHNHMMPSQTGTIVVQQ
jgi:hypothetical protein